MGVWGAGNFQNDEALDYLAEIQQSLLEKMEIVIANPQLAEPDERLCSELMVAIEIATLLCEHCNAVPPEPDCVSLCQETYLRVWDEYIDELDPDPAYKAERRQVIQASFEKLLQLSEKWHHASDDDG